MGLPRFLSGLLGLLGDHRLEDQAVVLLVQAPGDLVACGGWSKRKTLYGADQWTDRHDDLLDPSHDAAKIRAFFIHPHWARRGIGTLLLEACESAAESAGFSRFEMGATLTGAKLFRARGYLPVRNLEVPLRNGESLPIIHMEKQIVGRGSRPT